jgi:hypothetical protein
MDAGGDTNSTISDGALLRIAQLALRLFDHDEFDNIGERSKANAAVEQ